MPECARYCSRCGQSRQRQVRGWGLLTQVAGLGVLAMLVGSIGLVRINRNSAATEEPKRWITPQDLIPAELTPDRDKHPVWD